MVRRGSSVSIGRGGGGGAAVASRYILAAVAAAAVLQLLYESGGSSGGSLAAAAYRLSSSPSHSETAEMFRKMDSYLAQLAKPRFGKRGTIRYDYPGKGDTYLALLRTLAAVESALERS